MYQTTIRFAEAQATKALRTSDSTRVMASANRDSRRAFYGNIADAWDAFAETIDDLEQHEHMTAILGIED
jgi:hypothetical protein